MLPQEAAAVVAPLCDALVAGRWDEAEEVASAVAAGLWDDETREAVEEGLSELEEELRRVLQDVLAARRELVYPAEENLVARAVAFRAAADVQSRRDEGRERLAALEPRLAAAGARERRQVISGAPLPVGVAPLARDELGHAYVEWVRERGDDAEALIGREDPAWFARRLATDDLRRSVREWPRLVATELLDELPLAAAGLLELLDEPLPDDPAEDVPWLGYVREELALPG